MIDCINCKDPQNLDDNDLNLIESDSGLLCQTQRSGCDKKLTIGVNLQPGWCSNQVQVIKIR